MNNLINGRMAECIEFEHVENIVVIGLVQVVLSIDVYLKYYTKTYIMQDSFFFRFLTQCQSTEFSTVSRLILAYDSFPVLDIIH